MTAFDKFILDMSDEELLQEAKEYFGREVSFPDKKIGELLLKTHHLIVQMEKQTRAN